MTIDVTAAVALAIEQSKYHEAKAAEETGDAKRAHLSTMRAFNGAAFELVNDNTPKHSGIGKTWLVKSRTTPVVYRVDLDTHTCTCPNGQIQLDKKQRGEIYSEPRCWHYAAAGVCDEVLTREANGGDLLPQGARDLLAEHDGFSKPSPDWCGYDEGVTVDDLDSCGEWTNPQDWKA